jgi:hypothetical protein
MDIPRIGAEISLRTYCICEMVQSHETWFFLEEYAKFNWSK